MNYKAVSIRTFIGAKNYAESRAFYKELGWKENVLFDNMVVFHINDSLSFYLQDYYEKKWTDNSMVFLEVDDVEVCYEEIKAKGLVEKYKYVRLTDIKTFDWGREFFLHDPTGVLWHFGQFNPSA